MSAQMVKCLNCKEVFCEDDCDTATETHGLDCGPYERLCACPYCGSTDFEDYHKPPIEVEDYEYDFDTCFNISKKASKEKIMLNELIVCVLKVEDIEQILLDHIRENNISCRPYIEWDIDWFAAELKKETTKDA